MCSDRRKNHGYGQKKTECPMSAALNVRTAAKCCELTQVTELAAARNKHEVFVGSQYGLGSFSR